MGGGLRGLLLHRYMQVSHCVSFAGSKWMLRVPLMEMCFFTFHWVFIKDCLKEKSDVSFMASPSGNECYHCAPPRVAEMSAIIFL